VTTVINESIELLRSRLSELDGEREQVLVALQALEQTTGNGASAPSRKPGRPRAAATAATSRTGRRTNPRSTASRRSTTNRGAGAGRRGPTRGRRDGSTQADRLLKLVGDNPGITVAQAATKFGMASPNALYAVASRLAREGKVTKQGTGYHLA